MHLSPQTLPHCRFDYILAFLYFPLHLPLSVQNLSAVLLATALMFPYTLDGGLPVKQPQATQGKFKNLTVIHVNRCCLLPNRGRVREDHGGATYNGETLCKWYPIERNTDFNTALVDWVQNNLHVACIEDISFKFPKSGNLAIKHAWGEQKIEEKGVWGGKESFIFCPTSPPYFLAMARI